MAGTDAPDREQAADDREPAGAAVAGDQAPADDAEERVMLALRSHMPITLLIDLTDPLGPDSSEISETEGGEADWLPTHPEE